MIIYSLSYFYYMIPGSDSHGVRGLTEYFFATGDLDPSKPYHSYFQWPVFFILEKITSSVLGLELRYLEFIFYALIGFLFVVSLYVYASKFHPKSGYIAVVSFFMTMHYYFNYQFAPFSLATGLLLILFMLEICAPRKSEAVIVTLIIFTGITLMHAFVCVFFILYTLMMYIIRRRQKFLRLLILELIIYFLVLTFLTQPFFVQGVRSLMAFSSEYGTIVGYTFLGRATPQPPIDAIASVFSRAVTIGTAIIMGIGFILVLIKRELRHTDYAILLSGSAYTLTGSLFPILGSRTLFMIAMPASLGASYLLRTKLKKYFKFIFLILLVLFTFVTISRSHYDYVVMFQTREAYQCENFMIDNYNWTKYSRILSHSEVRSYIITKTGGNAIFESDFSPYFSNMSIETYDSVVFTVGLGKSFLRANYSLEAIFNEIENKSDIVYNSGFSFIAIKQG